MISYALRRTETMPRSTTRKTPAPARKKPATAPRKSAPAKSASPKSAASRKTPPAPLEQVYVKNRAALRRWLAKHHATSRGIWLVYDKKSTRADRLAYADAVEEALCFGWIDSTVRPLDATHYMQLFTPRKPTSTWSKVNKTRVARLIEDGLMAPAGLATIEIAKANGSWSSLDSVEALEIPDDLASAFAANPTAATNFAAFSPSSRKAYLHWLRQAVREATRAERVAAVVEHCEANRKTRFAPATTTRA